ncbi:efflux RND transporter periplasmic adaptor subunit [Rubrivivax sp. A210]|uniref:efflux RND transporter periplasmic adaptor subunit n=1 Tax=Rubrivivax sp. A210 TaxID=2772301 RepID=UPI00191AB962|nr:biotin/lipoyl-binding protein [Rubrivivax sp. A210]
MDAAPLLADDAASTLALLQACKPGASAAERRFVLLNRSREAWPYQQALLWADGGVQGHSGVGQIDRLGPYAQWLERLLPVLAARPAGALQSEALPAELAAPWAEYWPAHALWLPAPAGTADAAASATDRVAPGWLLLRDLPWTEREAQALARWWALWLQQDGLATAAAQAASGWGPRWRALRRTSRLRLWAGGLLMMLAMLAWPVTLTVRAPGELVPRHPLVVRALVEGTVRALRVEPNQPVKAGQVLAELDDAGWQGRLQVARQALMTAEAEWRQISQQALLDPRAKSQLAAAQGRHEERRSEVAYLTEQLRRSVLVAPQDGVALIQDPGSWPGRSVVAGEAILKLAEPQDQELEAWLAVGDAIELPPGTAMALHLAGRTGEPVHAKLRLFAYEAEQRADLGLGYRLRGTLEGPVTERLGARGTVRLEGPSVPLAYWLLRRPLAALRETTGW